MTAIPRSLFEQAKKNDPYATMAVIETWQGSDMTDSELMHALKRIAKVRE